MVDGISPELAKTLSERGHSDADIARLFDRFAYHGELTVVYQKPNGDQLSPVGSSKHEYYRGKGYVAVAVTDDPPTPPQQPIEVPLALIEYADSDRVGIWRRDRDEIESSCRNAFTLISRNWKFCGLADEARHRAIAEARPIPSATVPVQSKQESPAPAASKGGVAGKASRVDPGSGR